MAPPGQIGALMMVGGVVVAFARTSCRWTRPTGTSSPSSSWRCRCSGCRSWRRRVPALLVGPVPALAAPALRGPGDVDRLAGALGQPSNSEEHEVAGSGGSRGRRRLSRSAPRGPPSRPARHCPLRNPDKPAVYLGDQVLTAAQVADEIEPLRPGGESKGLGRGSPAAVLALSRPEVLFNMSASMLVRLPHDAAAPTGLARRPRLRPRGRRGRDPRVRPGVLRRAGRRAGDQGPRAQEPAGAGPERGRRRLHHPGSLHVRAPAPAGAAGRTAPTSPASRTPGAPPASPRA